MANEANRLCFRFLARKTGSVARLYFFIFCFAYQFLSTNQYIQMKNNAAGDCPFVFYSLTHQKDMNLSMARKFNVVRK